MVTTEGAKALLQANRLAWQSQQATAYTAMIGTKDKPADINRAIDDANQAEQHILDGSNVKFSHSGQGVTATVTSIQDPEPKTISLTPNQFLQFLNVGINHWDKLQKQSVPGTLQQIVADSQPPPAGKAPDTTPGKAPPKGKNEDDDESEGNTGTGTRYRGGRDAMGRSTNPDPVARQYEDSFGPERTKFDPNTDDELIYRANRAFPPNSSSTNPRARQEWIAAQKQRAIANEINRTKPLMYPGNGR
jgi:hypothetical protein